MLPNVRRVSATALVVIAALITAELSIASPTGSAGAAGEKPEELVVLLGSVADAADVAMRAGARLPRSEDILEQTSSMIVEATPTEVARLRSDPRVRGMLRRGHTVELAMSDSVRQIGAPTQWSKGWTGAGRTIAIIDTGVSPDFGGRLIGQACFVGSTSHGRNGFCGSSRTADRAFSDRCFSAGVCGPSDPRHATAAEPCTSHAACQHGTAVAAVAARSSTPPGVARGAGVYGIRVVEANRAADLVDIYRALDHVIAMHDAGSMRVAAVNLSFTTGATFTGFCDTANIPDDAASLFHHAFRRLRSRGIAPVVAAGNHSFPDRLAFPACLSSAIAVGALDANNGVASYSNRRAGHTLFAPGGTETRQLSVPSAPGYATRWRGTSFAVPHVAGAMTILDQRYPRAGLNVKASVLQQVCVRITDQGNSYPRVDFTASGHVLYLHAVYQLFVQRYATVSEINRWCPEVRRGNLVPLTSTLAASDEWAGVEIRNLYRKILGRNADSAGYQYWLDRVRRGHHIEELAVYFYGGQEYFARAGGTNVRFVDRLYRDLLGRPSDSAGLGYWTDLLNRGVLSRSGVADGFYASIESRSDRVNRLYRTILGRSAEPAGLAYWTAHINDLGDVALAANLAASAEYYGRVS